MHGLLEEIWFEQLSLCLDIDKSHLTAITKFRCDLSLRPRYAQVLGYDAQPT